MPFVHNIPRWNFAKVWRWWFESGHDCGKYGAKFVGRNHGLLVPARGWILVRTTAISFGIDTLWRRLHYWCEQVRMLKLPLLRIFTSAMTESISMCSHFLPSNWSGGPTAPSSLPIWLPTPLMVDCCEATKVGWIDHFHNIWTNCHTRNWSKIFFRFWSPNRFHVCFSHYNIWMWLSHHDIVSNQFFFDIFLPHTEHWILAIWATTEEEIRLVQVQENWLKINKKIFIGLRNK